MGFMVGAGWMLICCRAQGHKSAAQIVADAAEITRIREFRRCDACLVSIETDDQSSLDWFYKQHRACGRAI